MVIEDFVPEIFYIPGPANIVADVISFLDMTNDPENTQINCDYNMENHIVEFADLFAGKPILDDIYPFSFELIQKEQVCNTKFIDHTKENPAYSINVYHEKKNTTS